MKFKISMLFAFIMCFHLNAQENIAQVEFETKRLIMEILNLIQMEKGF